MIIKLEFLFSAEREACWADIFKGLADGETGFRFQNRMSVFGGAVDEKLDAMMEEWSPLFFTVTHWVCKDNRITASFMTSSEGEFFAEDLEELFALCGVKDLQVKVEFDSE